MAAQDLGVTCDKMSTGGFVKNVSTKSAMDGNGEDDNAGSKDGEIRESSLRVVDVSSTEGGDGAFFSDGTRGQSGEGGVDSRNSSRRVGGVDIDAEKKSDDDDGGERISTITTTSDSVGKKGDAPQNEVPSGAEEKTLGDPDNTTAPGGEGDAATITNANKGDDREADNPKSGQEGKKEGSDESKQDNSVAAIGAGEATQDGLKDAKEETEDDKKKARDAGNSLSIDIAAANARRSASAGVPASDVASKESSYLEEDVDELEVDLDKPWEKPSKEHAKRAGKRMIWNNGMRHYSSTSIKEIGCMGVGMYLYFWMVGIVAIMFGFCTLLSLPAMVLNHQGNDGMAISETNVDSLGLVSMSYGNQGLNPDLVVESGCISSSVDCTGETVQVFGEAKDALWVGYILVGGEILIAIFFALFIVVLSERLEAKIEEIDDANVTPGDYTVMVRGLPADVTKEEVRKHFSDLYSLVTPSPSYPFLGVSSIGVGLFWGSTLGLLFGLLVVPPVIEYADLGSGVFAFGMGVCIVLLCMLSVYAVVQGCGIGSPRKRDTPLQEWEKGRRQREKKKVKASTSSSKYSCASGKVVPAEFEPDATGAAGGDGIIAKELDGTAVAAGAVDGDAEDVARLEKSGGGEGREGFLPLFVPGVSPASEVQPSQEPPPSRILWADTCVRSSFADGRPPDPLPCQSCLNTHDKSFLGGWVADVVLGNPVGDVLMGFMDETAAIAKISKARTVVRQMKTLGKAKELAKAEAKLAKLKANEEALMVATRKKRDPASLELISVAFVTFEHMESKRRCLEDFRYSRRGFCRWFQPTNLQFSRIPPAEEQEQDGQGSSTHRRGKQEKPRVQRWRLKVFQAPEPSDVKWENLDVTSTSRKLRRAFTSLVCVVLLILSFVIINLAKNEQKKLQDQIPALDTCEEAIPAVVFGTYDFPLDAALRRNEAMDSTCADGSFYLAFAIDADDPDSKQLDYANLPPIFSADGTSLSRASFEAATGADLCDEPCQPTSGGSKCRALSCYEDSWEGDYGCVSYSQSTMIGCFCLDAVVTSFQEHGLVDGVKVVANEQGAVCAPFLRDYAKANAIKFLAVISVVVVNTLLTSVMAKLAKFERHVSLSDYTSTVTAKLALAQFLNTALIVIIVNAGYTGDGLGLMQDVGILAGEYSDFERSWYATVGVAIAMSMLINVVVPHATTLVGEIIVKPAKRLIKRQSVATQEEMNSLYMPPKFHMESRYAFLLQVLGVSLLYSGGIPVLYLFASFSFAMNFFIDKLWITKLAQRPPLYTAALAKMFIGVLPIALLVHMSMACYMLGNADILNIGFVSDEAQEIAETLHGQGISGLVADHVLRKHVFPLFVLTAVFIVLYVAYKIVGDSLLQLMKVVVRVVLNFLFGWMCKNKSKMVTEEYQQQPGYTAEFFRVLKKCEKIDSDEKNMGWVESEENSNRIAKWICMEDGPGPRGVKYKAGITRQTWQVIAELGQYNYVMEESDQAGMASRYMATAGFMSPRMKEKEKVKHVKSARLAVEMEEGLQSLETPTEAAGAAPIMPAAAKMNNDEIITPPAT